MLSLIDTVNPILNRQKSSLKSRFENLASGPSSYINGTFFKKLTGLGDNDKKGSDNITETIVGQQQRSEVFEQHLKELISNYVITPFAGSILLITSTESAAGENYASMDRGWKGYALSLKIHEISGDKKALIREPNAKKLVGALLNHIHSLSRRVGKL